LLQHFVTADNQFAQSLPGAFGLFGTPAIIFYAKKGSETGAARQVG